MRTCALWLPIASRWCGLVLVGLVLVLFAPIRTTAPDPVTSQMTASLNAAVAEALSAPGPSQAPYVLTAGPRTHRVDALTAQLIDSRSGAARPQSIDLGANRPATGSPQSAVRTAGVFGEHRDAADRTSDGSVTGAAVAVGSPDVGRRGGIGPATMSTSGSGGGAGSAVITGLNELPLHAGFTVARHTTRTGTIHASIRPLDRPG